MLPLLESEGLTVLTAIATMIGAVATIIIAGLTYGAVRHAKSSAQAASRAAEEQVKAKRAEFMADLMATYASPELLFQIRHLLEKTEELGRGKNEDWAASYADIVRGGPRSGLKNVVAG